MNDTEVNKTIQQMVRYVKLSDRSVDARLDDVQSNVACHLARQSSPEILHMYRFIKQEAEEKSSEIAVAAEEEFNITKLQLLEAEKAKVRRDFERKEKANATKKKVEYSKYLNENRIKVLQAREDAVQRLLKDAQKTLQSLSMNVTEYGNLMLELIVQGMCKLGEPSMLVRCREIDTSLVESLLPDAAQRYAAKCGKDVPVLNLDTANPLPPPPKGIGEQMEYSYCSGGVVITSADRSIECSNTLDDRLRIAYMSNLPAIRKTLFS